MHKPCILFWNSDSSYQKKLNILVHYGTTHHNGFTIILHNVVHKNINIFFYVIISKCDEIPDILTEKCKHIGKNHLLQLIF